MDQPVVPIWIRSRSEPNRSEPTGCAAGWEPYRRVSGAGHDAMILAEKIPAAMIFLRTPGGISHDPAEAVIGRNRRCGESD